MATNQTPYDRVYTAQSAHEHLYRIVEQYLRQHISRHGDAGWRKADPDRLVADIMLTMRAGLDTPLSDRAHRLAVETTRELLARCTCGAQPGPADTYRIVLEVGSAEVTSDAQ